MEGLKQGQNHIRAVRQVGPFIEQHVFRIISGWHSVDLGKPKTETNLEH